MTPPYHCEVCICPADWRIDREGDAIVTWSCDGHLAVIFTELQRDHEVTRLIVRNCERMRDARS